MNEELGEFFARTARPASNWKAGLMGWADMAVSRGTDLEACQPGTHSLLLEGARELKRAIAAPDDSGHEGARENIAILCTYVHANASCLHEHVIPAWETQAHSAAQDIERAALHILLAMDNDWGDLQSH